jgi:cytochrome c-type biogenesis protein CcmH/NrfF
MLKSSKTRLLLALALAGICLPQTATKLVTPEVRRVGDKLACKCKSCNNTVATCQMLECHYSLPAREKIAQMQKTGASDQSIVDAFVKEEGLEALSSPPTQGFSLLGWIMPFIGICFGIVIITMWFKRFARPRAVAVGPEPVIDRRLQARIDKELEELE